MPNAISSCINVFYEIFPECEHLLKSSDSAQPCTKKDNDIDVLMRCFSDTYTTYTDPKQSFTDANVSFIPLIGSFWHGQLLNYVYGWEHDIVGSRDHKAEIECRMDSAGDIFPSCNISLFLLH